jgi:hypothetical protein
MCGWVWVWVLQEKREPRVDPDSWEGGQSGPEEMTCTCKPPGESVD